MNWVYDDGGVPNTVPLSQRRRNCVARSVAIATRVSYPEVCALIEKHAARERPRGRTKRSDPARGVHTRTIRRVLDELGWTWTPTMQIGSGTTVHLRDGELPMGRLVISASKHLTAVIDGVIHDVYDPSRGGTRCVYGYFKVKES